MIKVERSNSLLMLLSYDQIAGLNKFDINICIWNFKRDIKNVNSEFFG